MDPDLYYHDMDPDLYYHDMDPRSVLSRYGSKIRIITIWSQDPYYHDMDPRSVLSRYGSKIRIITIWIRICIKMIRLRNTAWKSNLVVKRSNLLDTNVIQLFIQPRRWTIRDHEVTLDLHPLPHLDELTGQLSSTGSFKKRFRVMTTKKNQQGRPSSFIFKSFQCLLSVLIIKLSPVNHTGLANTPG